MCPKYQFNSCFCRINKTVRISEPCKEGPEGVKWELGFAHFLAGKMGFHALGLGFINKKTIENGNGTKILSKTGTATMGFVQWDDGI